VVISRTSFDAEAAALHSAACEHFNHTFMWRSLIPFGAQPSGSLRHALTTTQIKLAQPSLNISTGGQSQQAAGGLATVVTVASSGSSGGGGGNSSDGVEKCKRMLQDACLSAAASGGGWCFLVYSNKGQCFEVIRYRPGLSPITSQLVPLVAINMQYHARYVDYGGDSVLPYIDNCIKAINWKVAEHFYRMEGDEM
jgi:superoxide dismutase